MTNSGLASVNQYRLPLALFLQAPCYTGVQNYTKLHFSHTKLEQVETTQLIHVLYSTHNKLHKDNKTLYCAN